MTLFHIRDCNNKIIMAFRTKTNNLKIKDIIKLFNCDLTEGDSEDEEWLKIAYGSKDNIINIKQNSEERK